MKKIGVGIPGFFLRKDIWKNLEPHFDEFIIFDNLRDEGYTLEEMVDFMSKKINLMVDVNSKVYILGHSVGAVPAILLQSLISVMEVKVILLSGVGYDSNTSIYDYSHDFGLVQSVTRLNFDSARLELSSPESFCDAIDYPRSFNYKSASESLDFTLSVMPPIDEFHNIHYVVCEDDKVLDSQTQMKIAKKLNCETFHISGGHMAALDDTSWVEKVL